MTDSRCINFPDQQGRTLHGILHEPDASGARGVCVLLLSPGIKGRVGPHRLYLKIAARLVPLGFHVLRFDFHGLGDSEGAVSERQLVDMYNTVHGGRYVGDTIAAMDSMQSAIGVRRFVGSGLCGGSISALLTAEVDERIECLLGIGLPTVLEGGPENWAKLLTKQQAILLRGRYFRKILDLASWKRFITGRSSYEVIWRIVRQWASERKPTSEPKQAAPAAQMDCTNPRFASAFMRMLESSRPMLLIYSGADRLRYQFAEHFESNYAAAIEPFRHLYDVHLIHDANHVLSSPEWVAECVEAAEQWLVARYPQRATTVRST